MKAFTILPSWLMTVSAVLAISQGGGGFFNLANMHFEDFAALADTHNPALAPRRLSWTSPAVN